MGTKFNSASVTSVAATIFSAGQACNKVLVQANPANTVDVIVGDSTAQVVYLSARESAVFSVDNVSKIFAKTASGTATLGWAAETRE